MHKTKWKGKGSFSNASYFNSKVDEMRKMTKKNMTTKNGVQGKERN